MITNTTYRFLVEKLGDSNPTQFVGNEGEVFYDPNNPLLKLSDGSTPGGVSVGSGGGGGGFDEETDPIFSASVAFGITSTDTSNWDTAYGWGDHSVVGYQTSTSTSYAQTLIVDPNGSDVTGNGGPNAPFKSLQAAHDYAVANIDPDKRVAVRINAGEYIENLTVTRSRTNFVGLTNGHSRSNTLRGNVNVQISSLTDTADTTSVAFENLLIVPADGDNSDVFTVSGNIPCNIFLKDVQLFTWSTTAKCLFVNTSASAGISVHVNNVLFQNQLSSGATLDFFNTKYANLSNFVVFSGSGVCLDIKTTRAVVYNARFDKSGTSAAINATSGFGALPSLVLGNVTVSNSNANGVGIDIANSTVTIAQTTFNIGTSVGTGRAVKGVAGSVFVNGNNLIVPGTNDKISDAITAIPLGTSLTPTPA